MTGGACGGAGHVTASANSMLMRKQLFEPRHEFSSKKITFSFYLAVAETYWPGVRIYPESVSRPASLLLPRTCVVVLVSSPLDTS